MCVCVCVCVTGEREREGGRERERERERKREREREREREEVFLGLSLDCFAAEALTSSWHTLEKKTITDCITILAAFPCFSQRCRSHNADYRIRRMHVHIAELPVMSSSMIRGAYL